MTWLQSKKTKGYIEVTFEDIIDQDNPFSTFDNF